MKKIVIDCFGCDNPIEVIKGCGLAARQYKNVKLVLCGDQKTIKETLADESDTVEILHAPDIITNNDSPVRAIKSKPLSSLVVAYNALNNDCDALISAGSTGAVLCGGVMLTGKAEGVERPTLVSPLPNDKGTVTYLTDCGANVDCSPLQLLQFAACTCDYVKKTGIQNPKVALLSVGTEDKKGNSLTKEAFMLLKESELDFVGNMEANTALSGNVDVIVADGFYGNILLKCVEGTAKSIIKRSMSALKNQFPDFTNETLNKVFASVIKDIDFNNQGGAILLGLKKPVIKAHGSASAQTILNTVKQVIPNETSL